MRFRRPSWPILLAIIAVLLPTSFAAAATLVTRIVFAATNFKSFTTAGIKPPVDPVVGFFEFQFKENTNSTTLVFPTRVQMNYDSFTPHNVVGNFEGVDVDAGTVSRAFLIGGTIGDFGAVGSPLGPVGGENDFVLEVEHGRERPDYFDYTTSGSPKAYFSSLCYSRGPCDLLIGVQTFASPS